MCIIITLVCLVFVSFYVYRRKKLNIFNKLGINGPPPHFLFGNILDFKRQPFYELLPKWSLNYGKVFGYFEGPTPNLVIGDVDLIQEIFVKKFGNFHGRKLFPLQGNPDKEERVSMFLARGKRWKRLRATTNPAFSESKLRKMFPLIDESISSFISKIDQLVIEEQSDTEVLEYFQRLTMDIICKCAFGVETNCQTNINHPFIVLLKRFLSQTNFSNIRALIALTFIEFRPLILFIIQFLNKRHSRYKDQEEIRSKLIQVIEARKKSSEKRYDLLQLLLDAEVGTKVLNEESSCLMNENPSLSNTESVTEDEKTGEDNIEDKPKEKIKVSKAVKSNVNSKQLSTEEVISQANLFLFAGYETSSTALSYTIHLLATHPDVQMKLQQEIDQAYLNSGTTDIGSLKLYDLAVKLPYLKAVIYEVLRLYPFTSTVVNRLCLAPKGIFLSNGLYIPKGVNVIPNIYEIHFDNDIWTTADPKEFVPERFLVKTDNNFEFIGLPHPFAWMPFGGGPRNCIGQRFAMMVINATLMRFFYSFQVKISKNTENPLTLRVGATIAPKNGVHVEITKRIHDAHKSVHH